MIKAIRMTLMLIGLLPLSIALADNSDATDLSRTAMLQAIESPLTPMPQGTTGTRLTFSTMSELEFRDSSAIGRAKSIRSLSLLTLAEFRKSRLFLGVNKRGLLGLHFNTARQSGNRCLEVARMPYLRKNKAE